MLAELIHKIAAQFDNEPHDYYPRPSIAGPDRCIRQMVYWGLGFPREPFPGRTMVIFNDSSFHEDLTLDWLRKSAFKVHSEQMEVDCRKPMDKGHIDCIIRDELTQRDFLVEHKAINHFTFQKYWDGEIPLDYMTQTCIYYDALELITEVAGAYLLIKNKNTAAYLEYLLILNNDNCLVLNRMDSNSEIKIMNITLPMIVSAACEKFNSVADYVKEKHLPKRPYDIDDWQCNYCGYGKTCWGDYQKEFFELKTDVMLPNEVADMVRFYKELGAEKKEMGDEYETLKNKIKTVMKENSVREGFAGEYILRLKLDKANKERLYISNPKKKEVTDGVQSENNED